MNEEAKEVIQDDDIIMPDDIEDTPIDDEDGETEEQPKEEPTSDSKVKPQEEPEDDDKKFLDYLNKKGIKYNGESVELKSLDDVVNNIQKGMNYDKLKAKNDTENSTVMSYISEMANKMGMTPTQYIEQVKSYQKQREEEAKETEVQKLMSDGVGEKSARRLVEVEALAEQLKAERAELQKQRDEAEKKANEDKEYEDFLNAYPDVDVSKIPDEVYKDAKIMGLQGAYTKYENKLLKEKIKTLEQNVNNASNSVVVPTSEGSPTEQESQDAFLLGFDSED